MRRIAFSSLRVISSKEKTFRVNISIVILMRHDGISNKLLKEKMIFYAFKFGTNLNKNLNTLKIEFTWTLKTN